MQDVQKQRLELEKGEAFPDVEDSEVKRLRTEWLKHTNELLAGEERLYQLEFKTDNLKEEKRLLEREYARMPKKEEIDKQVKDLEGGIEDLKIEIAQRSHEGNTLKEELQLREQQIEVLSKNVENRETEQQSLKVCFLYGSFSIFLGALSFLTICSIKYIISDRLYKTYV